MIITKKLIALLIFVMAMVACWAEIPVEKQRNHVVPAAAAVETNSQDETAGIQPVSPEEFTGRVESAINKVYKAASPLADSIAIIMLSIAGIALMFSLFGGISLFTRVLGGAVLSVVIGLLLLYGAPYIVGVIKGFS